MMEEGFMVKSDILSAGKVNHLYWLGRYEERVYMTLHFMHKCYDKMIDGDPDDYMDLWHKLDLTGIYSTKEEFTLGMLYDEQNPTSLISSQRCAMDNAILLREDILSETLSYLEMSTALLRRCKAEDQVNLVFLQSIIDWSLAFWGSAEQRSQNYRALTIMLLGRHVELIDMLIRFGYPYARIEIAYEWLKRQISELPELIDSEAADALDQLVNPDDFNLENEEYKDKLLKYVNQVVRA